MSLFAQNTEFFKTVSTVLVHTPSGSRLSASAAPVVRGGFLPRRVRDVCRVPSVQSLRRVRLFATPWTAAPQASPCTTSLLRLVGDAIQPSQTLSSPLLLPPIPPGIRVFSSESDRRVRWPQYRSLSIHRAQERTLVG